MHSRERLAMTLAGWASGLATRLCCMPRFARLAPLAGGPDQIHLALKDALTAEGTLMMYAVALVILTKWAGVTSRRSRSGDSREVAAFDHSRQGRLATWDTRRVPPNLSRLAGQSPCCALVSGENMPITLSPPNLGIMRSSAFPLDRFLSLDGKILLLGSDHDAVTFLHYVEHVIEIPANESRGFRYLWRKVAAVYGVTWRI